jgi:flagellar M-ring protein FliF
MALATATTAPATTGEMFSQTLRDLPRAWQQLGRSRQIVVGGIATAVLLAIIGGTLFLQRPQQQALYTNLNEADASAIVAKLKEKKVAYTLTDGGGTVLVPSSEASDLRLQLASAGLPTGAGAIPGFELFDKTNFGVTDFAQRLNYQRGLEGELTKTIARLSPVESARVHLVLPQDRLLASQQKDTTASVVIKLRPGARLTDDQVATVRNLVAKSVEGLKPENVAVVDVNGNSLGKLDNAQGARDEQAATRLQLQRQRESELETKIQGMLTQALGANRAIVRANINLDWDDVKTNTDNYTAGATLSRQDNREQFTGNGAQVAAPGGVPGVQPNIPSFQTIPGGTTDQSSFNSSKITENLQPNRTVETKAKAPGDVKNIGIAVMVDQGVQAAQVDQITQLVTAAAGIVPSRGDQVSVVTLPFDTTMSQQLTQAQKEQTLMDYIALGFRVGGIMLGLGGLFLLFRMMSSAVKPRVPQVVVADSVQLSGGTAGLLPPATVQQQLADAVQSTRSRDELEAEVRQALRAELRGQIEAEVMSEVHQEVETRRREEELARAAEHAKAIAVKRDQMKGAVTKLANAKPEALADVLNQWLEQSRAATAPAPRRATSALN